MRDPIESDEERSVEKIVKEKLLASDMPGLVVEFSAEECEVAGAFIEDALTVSDAISSVDEEAI